MRKAERKRTAGIIRAMVRRNKRKGNVKKKLYGLFGGECAEGSLLKLGYDERDRQQVSNACSDYMRDGIGHIGINDAYGGYRGKEGHAIFLRIADKLDGGRGRKRREDKERITRREQQQHDDARMLANIQEAEKHIPGQERMRRVGKLGGYAGVGATPCEPEVWRWDRDICRTQIIPDIDGYEPTWGEFDAVPGGRGINDVDIEELHPGQRFPHPRSTAGWVGGLAVAGAGVWVVVQMLEALFTGLVSIIQSAASAFVAGVNDIGPWVTAASVVTLAIVSINRQHVTGWWQRHQERAEEWDRREHQWRHQPVERPAVDKVDETPVTASPAKAVDEVDETPAVEPSTPADAAQPARELAPSQELAPMVEQPVEDEVIEAELVEPDEIEPAPARAAIEPPRPTNIPSWVDQGYKVYTPKASAHR